MKYSITEVEVNQLIEVMTKTFSIAMENDNTVDMQDMANSLYHFITASAKVLDDVLHSKLTRLLDTFETALESARQDAEDTYFKSLYKEEIGYNKGDVAIITDGFLSGEVVKVAYFSTLEDMYVVIRPNGERTLIFAEDLQPIKKSNSQVIDSSGELHWEEV